MTHGDTELILWVYLSKKFSVDAGIYDRELMWSLTNEDAIATGWFSIIVFVKVSRQRPDHNGVGNADVPHMLVEDKIL